jgi:LPXTG-motif cell wall-anchored protein
MGMKRRSRLALMPLSFVMLAAPLAGVARADGPSIEIEPVSGPAGTTVTVSGSGCPQSGWGAYTWSVHVQVGPPGAEPSVGLVTEPDGQPPDGSPPLFTLEGYPGRADADTAPNADGSWTVALTIGAPTAPFPPVPGRYPIRASCAAMEGSNLGRVSYATAMFEVSPELPRTGPAAVGWLLWLGVACLGSGLGLVRAARSRSA